MSAAAPDPTRDLRTLQQATDRLLASAAALDDAAVRAPSLLPGWTRGHVLAHVARNADALVNVLQGRPMYASSASRDADIERDAPRAPAAQLDDVRAAAARFQAAAAALSDADWVSRCELRNGVTDLRSRVPFRRLVEVELHHVDLGTGYTLEQLPAEFVHRETDFLAERFAGRPDVPSIGITAADGSRWRTGRSASAEPEVAVSGDPAALIGWLAGRTRGEGLDAGGGELPVLPPL